MLMHVGLRCLGCPPSPPPSRPVPPAVRYNRHQNCLPSVFAEHTQHCSGHNSHPALAAALGCLPGDHYGIDRAVMNNTLHEILSVCVCGSPSVSRAV
jgi:hypothetical protein